MRWIGGLVVGLSLLGSAFAAAAGGAQRAAPDARQLEFFEKSVRPVLAERCFGCHSSRLKAPMGGLALDTRAGRSKGAAAGPAVTPADPDASPLLRAVRYADPRLQMPPTGKLPEREIAVLAEWVRMGAPWGSMKAEGGRRKSPNHAPRTRVRPLRPLPSALSPEAPNVQRPTPNSTGPSSPCAGRRCRR